MSAAKREPNGAQDYLEMVVALMAENGNRPRGWLYDGPNHFVLSHGHVGGLRTLTPDGASGTLKECYSNAGQLAIDNDGLTYVEGIATTAIIPLSHAWCVDPEGRVIDPTWFDHEETDYFGVEFATRYLIEETLRTETWGVLWENECRPNLPLLRGEVDDWGAV